jgi:3-hydroxyacyl-CoA dehydrogenase/3a,7a,12a-trihydroxy-5b-cholest-24-enoyl-CoA hydratase
VKEHPELVRSVGCEYQFILKDPDSSWVLDLKTGAGSVRAGNAEKPDCTLRLSNSDWLDMVAGAADPMKLFQSGRLKIAGNVMASQKLDFLKKIERKGSSRPETTAAAVSNEPIRVSSKTPDLVAAIKRQLVEQPQVSKEIGAMIAFRIKEGGSFTMDCRATPAVVFDGVDASAAAVVTLSDEAFGRLVAEGAVHTLFQHGELRVDGAMAPIHRLQVLKQLVVG